MTATVATTKKVLGKLKLAKNNACFILNVTLKYNNNNIYISKEGEKSSLDGHLSERWCPIGF